MKHAPDIKPRRRPGVAVRLDDNETLGAVGRFLRRHEDASYCYACLEDQIPAPSLAAILKPYPGTPYRFEKAYCAACAHWKPCVIYLSN